MKRKFSDPRPRPLEVRFWEKVDKSGDCWLWLAHVKRNGYGQFTIRHHVSIGAHQMAYRLAFGEIPPGLVVCHHCDNPLCVRPSHLFLGTKAENLADMRAKGRGAKTWKRRAPLTREQREQVKALYQPGVTSLRQLGEQFGVTRWTIAKIIAN